MASTASQLIEEVSAHAQSDSLEDAQEICADGSYFPNKLRIMKPTSLRRMKPDLTSVNRNFFVINMEVMHEGQSEHIKVKK